LQKTGAIPIIAQVFAWVPGVLAAVYAAVNFVWAMFNSQTARITAALSGTKTSVAAELGVMDKIKYEVNDMVIHVINYATPFDQRCNISFAQTFCLKCVTVFLLLTTRLNQRFSLRSLESNTPNNQ